MANESIGSYRDLEFEFDELTLLSELDLSNVKGKVRINRTSQGLLVDGNFQAYVVGQCVRCLEDINQPLETEIQELFAYRTRHTRDEEFFVPEDGIIDLEPLVYQNMLLVVPIKQLCKPNCKGLCSFCGNNLNFAACEHQDAEAAS
jgi:uncharacterized protein